MPLPVPPSIPTLIPFSILRLTFDKDGALLPEYVKVTSFNSMAFASRSGDAPLPSSIEVVTSKTSLIRAADADAFVNVTRRFANTIIAVRICVI